MRACHPDVEGFIDHGGVKIGYEVYGDGHAPTVFLMPTWTIVHVRFWKLQIPYLARHFRVVTFDGPGNGRSDRPPDSAPYATSNVASAAVRVLDEVATERAVLVSLSKGAHWSLELAADRPERVLGQVFISPSLSIAPPAPERQDLANEFHQKIEDPQGWEKYNAHYWIEHYEEFVEFFFAQCLSEPHSTKQREDAARWASETTPEILIADTGAGWPTREDVLAWCARVTSPVLVIHGTGDRISPHERGVLLAEATGGALVTMEGSGHLPPAREPVRVNLLLRDFVELVAGLEQVPR